MRPFREEPRSASQTARQTSDLSMLTTQSLECPQSFPPEQCWCIRRDIYSTSNSTYQNAQGELVSVPNSFDRLAFDRLLRKRRNTDHVAIQPGGDRFGQHLNPQIFQLRQF